MKSGCLLNAVLGLIVGLTAGVESGRPEGKPMRSVYGFNPDLAPFEGKSPEAIAKSLRDMGIDSVFGAQADPAIARAVREIGIRNYAEIGVFVGKDLQERFPGSIPVDSDGKRFVRDGWYYPLIPTHPEVVRLRLARIEDLFRNEYIDGVWLDFIRWPSRWEMPAPELHQTSFDPISLSRFFDDTGIVVPPRAVSVADQAAWILANRGREWIDWKCRVITGFVAEAKRIRDRVAPGKALGIFTVPWRGPEMDGAALRIVAQDIAGLAPYIDIFSPMVYHRLTGHDVRWIGEVARYVAVKSGKTVWPIVQAMSEPDELSNEEFGRTISAGIEAEGSSGVIVFTLGHVVEENKLETMTETFRKYRR